MAEVALELDVLFAGALRGEGEHGLISYSMDTGSGSNAAQRWAVVRELLDRALGIPPAGRNAFLDGACADDAGLRAEVDSLLRAAEGSAFLDQPLIAAAGDRTVTMHPPAGVAEIPVGRVISHYRVTGKIGEGGMGAVYKAVDVNLGREVAVKVISREVISPKHRQRFAREAKAASALNHPNIVTIYEYNSVEGVDFIAMEFIEGAPLNRVMAARKAGDPNAPSLPKLLEYARQTASALTKAHAKGIVHRDLKPANIMLTPEGIVKVLDFGLAKVTEPDSDNPGAQLETGLTNAGAVMGTPAYMSPEQALGEKVDWRSDIFSFGVILYEMVSGARPFVGANTVALLKQIVHAEPVPVAKMNPAVPEGVAALIDACMKKDRDQRLQSLAGVLGEGGGTMAFFVGTFAPEVAVPPVEVPRKWSTAVLASGVAAVALLGAGVWQRAAIADRVLALLPARTVAVPVTAYEHYQLGATLLERYDRQGNVDKAIEAFQKAIQLDAQSAPAFAGLAQGYVLRYAVAPDAQWLRLAREAAEKSVQIAPSLGMAHAVLGRVMTTQGQLSDAERELDAAFLDNPKDPVVFLYRASLLTAQQKRSEAEKELRAGLELEPNRWLLSADLGSLLYRRGDYEDALAVLNQALQLTPDNAILHRTAATSLYMLNRYDEAAAEFQKSLEIQPSAVVYNNLGTLRFFQGRFGDAVAPLEKAVELSAGNYLYWGNLGDAYRWAPGQRDKSKTTYTRAAQLARAELERKPNDPDLHSRLAIYLAKLGDLQASRVELGKLPSTAKSGLLKFRVTIAWELLGERDKALTALGESLGAGYSLNEIEHEPELVALRADRRYQLLVATSGTATGKK